MISYMCISSLGFLSKETFVGFTKFLLYGVKAVLYFEFAVYFLLPSSCTFPVMFW